MPKAKPYSQITPNPEVVAESRLPYCLRTYVSLFSSAGVGCYGFKEESFYCMATVELLERRLKIQEHNNKCI
jgi:DNA (cytosine-5)-methyltransferase 1